MLSSIKSAADEYTKEMNISRTILNDKDKFRDQSELYRAEHNRFLFTKPQVGSRADRVYIYYAYNQQWRADKYLRTSQEADFKPLVSREGRKLNLHDYHKKMTPKPVGKGLKD